MGIKYLFLAEFNNGDFYHQNPEDTSLKFPPVKDKDGNWQGKSSFTDIAEDVETLNIKSFSLYQNLYVMPEFKVDLTDGHFEVNGMKFEVEGERPLPLENAKFKLIYYRTRRHQMDVTYKLKTGTISKTKSQGELPIRFVIGWQCNINGKNYQQKIIVE